MCGQYLKKVIKQNNGVDKGMVKKRVLFNIVHTRSNIYQIKFKIIYLIYFTNMSIRPTENYYQCSIIVLFIENYFNDLRNA